MAIDRSKYKSVDERTDGSWPEKDKQLTIGDSIEGVYTSKKEGVGTNNSNIYVLETDDGRKIGVWGSTVLDAKFEGIEVGSRVGIEYLGNVKGKGPKPYKTFWVGVIGGEGQAPVNDDIPF
jgi:hypothetical protein